MKYKVLVLILVLFTHIIAEDNKQIDFWIENGNYIDAIELLQGMTQKNPNIIENYMKLGKIYLSLKMYNESIEYFQTVTKLDSTNTQAQILLGSAFMNSDKYYDAVIQFTQILKRNPENIKVKKLLAELYFKNDKYSDAKRMYEQLASFQLLKNNSMVNIGLCELKLGNIEESLNVLEQAYQENPHNLSTVLLLNRAYVSANLYTSSKDLLKFELKKYPLDQRLMKDYAGALFKLQNFNEALSIYNKLQDDPVEKWFRYQKMGMCHYYLDKPKYAELYLNQSFIKDSTNSITTYYLALSMVDLEKFEEADKMMSRTILLSTPSFFSEAYMRKAICNEQLSEFQESLKNFQLAAEYAPDRQDIHYYIATLIDMHFDNADLAILKYKYFLELGKKVDPAMIKYAEVRLEELEEYKIFK